ncbi:site-specific integrase [Lysinibacillus irui]|uniref:tyrosine-type recombinase/integrase n=1 Tax=Lysinibacillus irui TaxID=2998077 RepID=UPI003D28A66D
MAKIKAIKSYKLVSGETRYKFKIYLGTASTGKRIETTRRGFKTITAATNEYLRLKIKFKEGYRPEKKTFSDIYNEWLSIYQKSVKPSTYHKTKQLFHDHILPCLGHIKIQSITYKHCENAAFIWYDQLKKHKTVEHYAAKVFDYAMKLDVIERNPMKAVTTPIKMQKGSNKDYYSREELIEFLEATKNEDIKKYAFLRLLCYTGIRRGEGFSLQWSDINFDKKEITINKAVTYDENGKLIISSTKTSDHRLLKIDDCTLEILNEWKSIQSDLYCNLSADSLVFSDKKNNITYPSKAWDWCNTIQEKYKLKKISPHDLRRTHATMYYISGATPYEIKKRLGHSFKDITSDVYIIETDEIKTNAFKNFIQYMNY